jgi:ribosome-binding factor A
METVPEMKKDQKTIELLRGIAGDFVSRESNRTSLVTVTRVGLENRGRRAVILFTVMPESAALGVLDFLKRKRSEFREYVRTRARLGRLPNFEFQIDYGEKNRQRTDALLQ